MSHAVQLLHVFQIINWLLFPPVLKSSSVFLRMLARLLIQAYTYGLAGQISNRYVVWVCVSACL